MPDCHIIDMMGASFLCRELAADVKSADRAGVKIKGNPCPKADRNAGV